jgi:hypothetical protein
MAVSTCQWHRKQEHANSLAPTNAVCYEVVTDMTWLHSRNAYHDMATADVLAGTGGVDASIIYETDRDENVGAAFSETKSFFVGLVTKRSSLADLFALAAIIAVGACSNGSLVIPFSAGRVDATEAGPSGVPQPQEDLATHTASFARQGFNATEMIALVACGHTIGGVHGADFPQIVPSIPADAVCSTPQVVILEPY